MAENLLSLEFRYELGLQDIAQHEGEVKTRALMGSLCLLLPLTSGGPAPAAPAPGKG